MKNKLTIGFLFLSLCVLFISLRFTTDKYRFDDLRLSGAEYEAIRQTRQKTEQELVTELYVNDLSLFYDAPNSRWFYSSSQTGDGSRLSIDFRSPVKDVKLGTGSAGTSGTEIPVIAYTQSEYKEYTLVTTPLPLIRIRCGTTDLNYQAIPMELTLQNPWPHGNRAVLTSGGSVHTRGHSTLRFPKKFLRVELTQKDLNGEITENRLPLLGLREDGDWLLYPAYNDQEKIRNVFSTNLWYSSCAGANSYDLKNGNEYKFVELFLDQQYWGLYALSYPIDRKQMKIEPDKDGHYDEFLYKQSQWGPVSEDYSVDETIELQFPAEESDKEYGDLLLQMYFRYLHTDAPDGLFHNDEKNALDIWLFTKLIQAVDTVSTEMNKNLFYTIKSDGTGHKLLYTPWDLDVTWGTVWGEGYRNMMKDYVLSPDSNGTEMRQNPVSVMMGSDPSVAGKIRERYAQLRSDGWSDEKIDKMLDGFERDIYDSGAYLRDMERWPEGSYADPELKLSVFRDYVHKRLESMDRYITGLGK